MLEATCIALLGMGLFEMPVEVSYCFGFCMATVAGAVCVPGMLALLDKGYGRNKGVATTMIASATFENI